MAVTEKRTKEEIDRLASVACKFDPESRFATIAQRLIGGVTRICERVSMPSRRMTVGPVASLPRSGITRRSRRRAEGMDDVIAPVVRLVYGLIGRVQFRPAMAEATTSGTPVNGRGEDNRTRWRRAVPRTRRQRRADYRLRRKRP